MKLIIRKYVIVAIVTVLLVHVSAFVIDIFFPEILRREMPDGIIKTYDFEYLSTVVEYFFNIP